MYQHMNPGKLKAPRLRGTRGSAIVVALITVTTIGALGAAFLRVSSSFHLRQKAELENLQAFYLAEAGLAESFNAVRIGRTGEIGSEASPARFGGGLLWVVASETANGNVRLESTGMVGSGRATLALHVEPVEVDFGFFSDEDLVIQSVLMLDGFDSEAATYQETIASLPWVEPSQDVSDQETVVSLPLVEPSQGASDQSDFGDDGDGDDDDDDGDDDGDDWDGDGGSGGDGGGDGDGDGDGDGSESAFYAEGAMTPNGPAVPASHTDSGGLLASNGSVYFEMPAGDSAEIWGDVKPGPDGSVEGLGMDVSVSGNTDASSNLIELPEVEVPEVGMAAPVRHGGVLPLVLPAGTSGHASIEVAPDCELVLRGPARIVIGTLTLEPGALMTLDTRLGDVELYITGGMDLQQGSVVTTTGEQPSEVLVQVAPITTIDKAPINLEATSQFHGLIFSPATDVMIGSEFEIYGGVVAKKLEIGAGARLHFDSSGFEGMPIPRIVSWRIIELPAALRGRGGDAFKVMGVTPESLEALSEAHDLSEVWLTIEYLDHNGVQHTFAGTEDQFNWDRVAEVLSIERDPTREKEEDEDDEDDDSDEDDEDDDPDEGETRQGVSDALANLSGDALRNYLQSMTPLSGSELKAMMDSDTMKTGGGEHATIQFQILQASTPLSAAVMKVALKEATNLYSADIRSVLIASTPLPSSVLQAVQDAPSSVLFNSDKEAILNAQ